MLTVETQGCVHHVRIDGPEDGRVVMFANSLGTDLRVWDALLPHLPPGLRILRYDKRGHGLSDCPPPPYRMETLVADAVSIIEALAVREVTFVGLSIGGLIGQGVAATRPDLLRSLVLMDTAAELGPRARWDERIEGVRQLGMSGMADGILERWFTSESLQDPVALRPWRNMLSRTPAEGYIGCCAAIAEADYTQSTAALSLPVMVMAGSEDLATPPERVRATADLCGAPFHEIAGAGHLPCVEQPVETARLLRAFLDAT